MTDGTLRLARATVGVVGAGALLMAIGTLSGGASLADPVFPAGLVMGALAVGAAAWVETPGTLPAMVTWLGLLGLLVGLAVFGSMVVRTPSPDVVALFAVPAAIILAAVIRLAVARRSIGGVRAES